MPLFPFNTPRRGDLLAGGAFLLLAILHLALPFILHGASPLDHVLAEGDGYLLFYPSHHLLRDALLGGAFPFWSDLYYGGFPLASDPQHAVWFLPAHPFLLLPASPGYHLKLATALALACWGTWLLLRRLGVRMEGAWVGALTFAFGGTILTRLTNQPVMVFAAAFLPWMALAAQRGRRWWPAVGLLAGFCLLAGHPQVALYTLAAFFAAWLLSSVHTFRRAWGHLHNPWMGGLSLLLPIVLAALAGGMLAGVQLLSGAELARGSVRPVIDRDFFFSYQFELRGGAMVFFPFLFGHYQAANWPSFGYLGPWNLNEMGASPGSQAGFALALLFVAVLARALMRRGGGLPPAARRHGLIWLLVGGVFFLFSLGSQTPLGGLLYHLPPFNLFRGLARLLLPVQFAVGILAGLGVHWWLGALERPGRRCVWLLLLPPLIWLAGALGALLLWFGSGAGSEVFAAMGIRERLSRLPRLGFRHGGIWIPLALCASAGVALGAGALWRRGRPVAALAGVVVVGWATAEALVNGYNHLPRPTPDPARREVPDILRGGEGRVAMAFPYAAYFHHHHDLPLPLVSAMHGIATLNGVSPLVPAGLNERLSLSVVGAADPPEGLLAEGAEALQALGVRWLVAPQWMLPPLEVVESAEGGIVPLTAPWIDRAEDGALFEVTGQGLRLAGSRQALSLGQTPVEVASNRWYRLTMTVRREGPAEGMPLHVDLYGPDYDLDALELTIGDDFVGPGGEEITALWFTGDRPAEVFLRLFTRSGAGLVVEDVGLEQIGSRARAGVFTHSGTRLGRLDVWELPPVAPVQLVTAEGETAGGGAWVEGRSAARKTIRLGDLDDGGLSGVTRLRLAMRHDPGWRGWYDDGTRTIALETLEGPHQQLDVLYRYPEGDIPLDRGEVHLEYRPPRFREGLFISLFGCLVILSAALPATRRRRRAETRRRRKQGGGG